MFNIANANMHIMDSGLFLARPVLSLPMAAQSSQKLFGWSGMSNGIELPLPCATGTAALTLTGSGPYSVDALLNLTKVWTPTLTWIGLASGVAGGIANLALRRPAVVAA